MIAAITLAPPTATPGATVTATCSGSVAGESRTVALWSGGRELTRVTTKKASVAIAFKAPAILPAVIEARNLGQGCAQATLAAAGPVTPPPSTGIPALPAATSAVTFDDTFTGGLANWRNDFHPPGIAHPMYDPALAYVGADGLLHLAVEKRADGWHGSTVDVKRGAGQFTQAYGIEECIFRLPAAIGAWWGGPWDYANSNAEIDGLEAGGRPVGSGQFAIDMAHFTVHFAGGGSWNGGGPVKVADLSKGWHVLRREWRPTFISWSMDGVELLRYDASAKGWVGKIPTEAMPLILDMTVDTQNAWPGMGPPDDTTPVRFEALVARVRVQA